MSYSVRTDIEAIFGVNNVALWGDMDGDENASNITARIAYMIAEADAGIDDDLRGTSLRLPLQTSAGATPTTITRIAARLAGVLLYEAYGMKDVDPQTGLHAMSFSRVYAEKKIEQIRSGKLKLDAVTGG